MVTAGKVAVNGTELYYEDTGGSGETLLFSHGLLWNTTLFAPQIAAFQGNYRCIAYDHRGQGKSADAPMPVIDMDTLCEDAVQLIGKFGLAPVHFIGHSMGGFVGIRLAARYPHLVKSLVLCSTSAGEEPNKRKFKVLNFFARWMGPKVVVGPVGKISYGRTALSDPARKDERKAWLRQIGSNRRTIWRAANGIIHRKPVYDELHRISAPTLVIVGEEDLVTEPQSAERLAASIRGARLVKLAGAGHSPTIEAPDMVNAVMADFLRSLS